MDENITENQFINSLSIFPDSDGEYDPENQPLFVKPYDTTKIKISEIDEKLKINKSKTKYWLKQY